ncbi:hypothetical protein SprV_0301341200 [Sparganum proliferum]
MVFARLHGLGPWIGLIDGRTASFAQTDHLRTSFGLRAKSSHFPSDSSTLAVLQTPVEQIDNWTAVSMGGVCSCPIRLTAVAAPSVKIWAVVFGGGLGCQLTGQLDPIGSIWSEWWTHGSQFATTFYGGRTHTKYASPFEKPVTHNADCWL